MPRFPREAAPAGAVEVIQQMKELGLKTRCILISATLGDAVLLHSLEVGVSGIVLKESAGARLIDSIRTVQTGQQSLPEALLARALKLARSTSAGAEPKSLLTPRERKIAESVAAGMPNKRIAVTLGITEATVKLHVYNIFKKLGVTNRVQLTRLVWTEETN
jgi:DNA-binding NarL/FixJ family response regulator